MFSSSICILLDFGEAWSWGDLNPRRVLGRFLLSLNNVDLFLDWFNFCRFGEVNICFFFICKIGDIGTFSTPSRQISCYLEKIYFFCIPATGNSLIFG